MRINSSMILRVFIWSLFMGVTAISIGFGAVFPSLNLISADEYETKYQEILRGL